MASIASSSTVHVSSTEAGPLPTKQGEIGYVEPVDQPTSPREPDPVVLPARHPADREAATTITPTPVANTPASPTPPAKKEALRFSNKVIFCGFHLGTFLTFWILFILFGGTIAAWVLVVERLNRTGGSTLGSSLFIHVAFGMAVLAEFIFIERRIYRLRAERYSYIHPGEILPTSNRRWMGNNATNVAFGPWNRPPLPTYAAALSQSGVGTGDVEDHLIAAQPPPAYGNTRGSTMLLSGHLRESLRAQRPVSEHSQMTQRDDRPLSYVSRDERWDEIQDAERARRLEETLGRLERTGLRS